MAAPEQLIELVRPHGRSTMKGFYHVKLFKPSNYYCYRRDGTVRCARTKPEERALLELEDLEHLPFRTLRLSSIAVPGSLPPLRQVRRLTLFRIAGLDQGLDLEPMTSLSKLTIDQCPKLKYLSSSTRLSSLRVFFTRLESVGELPHLYRLDYLNGHGKGYAEDKEPYSVAWPSAGFPSLERLLIDDAYLLTLPYGPEVQRWCICASNTIKDRLACHCDQTPCPYTEHWAPRYLDGDQYSDKLTCYRRTTVDKLWDQPSYRGYAGRRRPNPTCGYLSLPRRKAPKSARSALNYTSPNRKDNHTAVIN